MTSRSADGLRSGDRGRTPWSNLVVDVAGNKYLRSNASIELNMGTWSIDTPHVYVEVTVEDRIIVCLRERHHKEGGPLSVVPVPDSHDEFLVWVDELHLLD